MAGRKRWPTWEQPKPVAPPPIDMDALRDAVRRTVDAIVGALRKSMDGPDWPTYIARLNADERAVASALLSRSYLPFPHSTTNGGADR